MTPRVPLAGDVAPRAPGRAAAPRRSSMTAGAAAPAAAAAAGPPWTMEAAQAISARSRPSSRRYLPRDVPAISRRWRRSSARSCEGCSSGSCASPCSWSRQHTSRSPSRSAPHSTSSPRDLHTVSPKNSRAFSNRRSSSRTRATPASTRASAVRCRRRRRAGVTAMSATRRRASCGCATTRRRRRMTSAPRRGDLRPEVGCADYISSVRKTAIEIYPHQ